LKERTKWTGKLVAPDEVTFEYLKGRPLVPARDDWEKVLEYWGGKYSDADAYWGFVVDINTADITSLSYVQDST
jgi:homoaconitase/3-isopropylmalate dehydratase large subunit